MSASIDDCRHGKKRTILVSDSVQWLRDMEGTLPGSVFTSLPDISEMPRVFTGVIEKKLEPYKMWFLDAVSLIFARLEPGQCAVFLQSDVRAATKAGGVIEWIDKSFLCSLAAHQNGHVRLLWHKIALVRNVGARSAGRPSYSHCLCFQKKPVHEESSVVYDTGLFQVPDVLERGEMTWAKAIGLNCAIVGLSFLINVMKCTSIVDPFCGVGTVLALANFMGVDAVGVDISAKRCRKANVLNIVPFLSAMSAADRKLHGLTLPVPEIHMSAHDAALLEEEEELEAEIDADS